MSVRHAIVLCLVLATTSGGVLLAANAAEGAASRDDTRIDAAPVEEIWFTPARSRKVVAPAGHESQDDDETAGLPMEQSLLSRSCEVIDGGWPYNDGCFCVARGDSGCGNLGCRFGCTTK